MKEITTTQELEQAIESIDFTDLHKVRIENESGMSVWLYWDGEKVHAELHTQGTIPGNENAAFAFFRCGLDDSGYEEGWAIENEDGTFTTDNGRIISRSEMIAESIEVGEMSDTYDDWKDQIREDWESWQNKPTRPGSPGSHTKENGMKSLKKNLQDLTGENIDLQKELPEIGLDDLNIIDTKTFGEEITLWLCNDEDRNRYIIRDDSAGLRGICLFSSRDDQLTFAAWNVDFDITALTDWIDDETMTLAIEDAKAHHWEFSGPFNSRSPR